jgi:hypothetical protein
MISHNFIYLFKLKNIIPILNNCNKNLVKTKKTEYKNILYYNIIMSDIN